MNQFVMLENTDIQMSMVGPIRLGFTENSSFGDLSIHLSTTSYALSVLSLLWPVILILLFFSSVLQV